MDLKEFVSQTLSQIIDGVTDAQDSVSVKETLIYSPDS